MVSLRDGERMVSLRDGERMVRYGEFLIASM